MSRGAYGEGVVELRTGAVVPSTHGPHVEQVGWGVARSVARSLAQADGEHPLLAAVPDLAEAPGHAAYAVLEGREALALALVRLSAPGAAYLGEVVRADAAPGTREALVVRALHDAAAAGATSMEVPSPPGDLAGLALVSDH